MKRGPVLSLDLFGDRLLPAQEGAGDGGEHGRMLRAMMRAAGGELTARQAECVRLRYGEGKSMSEIAAQLGVTPPTVSRHLKKARIRLRKVLEYFYPGSDPEEEERPKNRL